MKRYLVFTCFLSIRQIVLKFVPEYGCNLGTYNTLEQAYKKYAEKKEEAIKQIAGQYKNIIPQELYAALLRYKVDIKNDRNYKM